MNIYESLMQPLDKYKDRKITQIIMPQSMLDDLYKHQEQLLQENERRNQEIKNFLNKNMIENSQEMWKEFQYWSKIFWKPSDHRNQIISLKNDSVLGKWKYLDFIINNVTEDNLVDSYVEIGEECQQEYGLYGKSDDNCFIYKIKDKFLKFDISTDLYAGHLSINEVRSKVAWENVEGDAI
jgi:hypothetical protein